MSFLTEALFYRRLEIVYVGRKTENTTKNKSAMIIYKKPGLTFPKERMIKTDLNRFAGERVRLQTVDNLIYIGTVGDYIEPEDDNEEKEMIIVDDEIRNTPVGFYSEDILSISII